MFTNPKLASFPVFAPIDSAGEASGKPVDIDDRTGFVYLDKKNRVS